MPSKRQRRHRPPPKLRAKPRKRLPPAPNALLGRQGLIADPNADLAPNKRQQVIAPVQVWNEPEPKPPKPKRLSEFDEKYLRPLLNKYGTDFEAMARDIKLNRDQLTAAKLRKMHKLLQADEASDVESNKS